MPDYGLSKQLDVDFDQARQLVQAALAGEGFGVLSEIDLAGTLNAKLGRQLSPQVILGACNPVLADRALQAEPSIGLLLPCNVVVRAEGEGSSVVEIVNPDIMVNLTHSPAVAAVAAEARRRLQAVLDSLG